MGKKPVVSKPKAAAHQVRNSMSIYLFIYLIYIDSKFISEGQTVNADACYVVTSSGISGRAFTTNDPNYDAPSRAHPT